MSYAEVEVFGRRLFIQYNSFIFGRNRNVSFFSRIIGIPLRLLISHLTINSMLSLIPEEMTEIKNNVLVCSGENNAKLYVLKHRGGRYYIIFTEPEVKFPYNINGMNNVVLSFLE